MFVPEQIDQAAMNGRPNHPPDAANQATLGASAGWPSRNLTVHQLFEEQTAATPNAAALILPSQSLSYAELNQRANRLAHQLLRLGVARGDLVGSCMERSPEVIVGLLGILKAGAAYVPLDPAYPDERVAFMLRDTTAKLTLAHRPTAARLAPFAQQTRILSLDGAAGDIATEPCSNPAVGATAEDLAYVMYTSGSTGNPKGVLVGHRAIVRLVRDTNYCHFGPDETFIHLAPLAFDASTFEIWGPLLNGSRLVMLPPFLPTPDELEAAIRRHGVTTLWLTAGLFHLVVEQRVQALASLRQLVAGGDVLSPTHVSLALAVLNLGVLINGYGPTESTTFACCYRMEKGYQPTGSIPIGRPIAHTTVRVLDEQLRPVAPGTPGELFIGGDGLAHGYLNNPELTRAKFIADPLEANPHARLYRTGDRVCARADGNLEFLGRVDSQLKIMGHRIEPGEIEAALGQHPSVRQAVVIGRTLPRGDKQLVAYVVPTAEFLATTLKQYLAERLPQHMIPGRIVQIDQLPLTHNGKVDRSALPALDAPPTSEEPAGPPGTEMEQRLTALWGRILNCRVGPDENFFDAGATSLQLLEVHAELTKALSRQICRTEFFEYPTIRALAGRLSGVKNLGGSLNQAQDRAKRQKESFARQKLAKGTRS